MRAFLLKSQNISLSYASQVNFSNALHYCFLFARSLYLFCRLKIAFWVFLRIRRCIFEENPPCKAISPRQVGKLIEDTPDLLKCKELLGSEECAKVGRISVRAWLGNLCSYIIKKYKVGGPTFSKPSFI